jgi:hypothetical protein
VRVAEDANDPDSSCVDCEQCRLTLHPESCDVYEVVGIPALAGNYYCTAECAESAAEKELGASDEA